MGKLKFILILTKGIVNDDVVQSLEFTQSLVFSGKASR